jgi:protocatechuate 3,4-dioxygenase beta subunit
MENHERDVYDLGLSADLEMLKRSPINRRRILKMGALGIGLLLAGERSLATLSSAAPTQQSSEPSAYLPLILGPAATSTATPTTGATATPTAKATSTPTATPIGGATATPTPTSTTSCVSQIPQETGGPYPGDGSNANSSNQTVNVLTRSGIVRSDIRTSISTGNTAPGVPLTIKLTLVDSDSSCVPLAGYAVYLWHCNRDGNYSLYSSAVINEDYLRGVQASDSNGVVTFTSIFPACYSGRWPHVHFEIYPSLATATTSANVVRTSQLALPKNICDTVYATTGYSASVTNLSQISLATDNVFSDGYSLQVATVTGSVANGYTAQLTVGVNV